MSGSTDTTAPPRLRLVPGRGAVDPGGLNAGLLESVREAEREIDYFLAGDAGTLKNVQRQRLFKMRETISSAHSLIDLATWKSRSEAGRIDRRAVDLRFSLRDALEKRAPSLRERGVRFEWEMPARPAGVTGDPGLFGAVIDFILAEFLRGVAPRSVIRAHLKRREGRFALRLEVRGRTFPRWRFRRAGALLAGGALHPLGGRIIVAPAGTTVEILVPSAVG